MELQKNQIIDDRKHIWSCLQDYYDDISDRDISSFFDDDSERVKSLTITDVGLTIDYSKNHITMPGLNLLIQLCNACNLEQAIRDLFEGKHVNNSEDRPALHTALRNNGNGLPESVRIEVESTYKKMSNIVDKLHQKKWPGFSGKPVQHVVNIGIGGSDLGPVMVSSALQPYQTGGIDVSFVSNIDGTHISETLKNLDPETTLFIISSKSFSTIETLKNAEAARAWLQQAGINDLSRHFIAISTNIEAATNFGVETQNILPMWDWVGGRYSLWSAIGLPIAIKIGFTNFERLLSGARSMDEHFATAPFEKNMPVIHALLAVWYTNFFNYQAQIVIPYDHYLHKLPSFLQQLEMESNGKSVSLDGEPVQLNTKGIIMGEAGTNTQHSFHQLLHQGTHTFPVDFIVPAKSHNPVTDQHTHLYANCLSQSRALMIGRNYEEAMSTLLNKGMNEDTARKLAPHMVMPGNRPSTTIATEYITPETLGSLIAMYEHKVYVESVIWGINAFDQWGVELGKEISQDIYGTLEHKDNSSYDASTNALIEYFQKSNSI